jgi:hypothetical protein
MLGKPRCRSPRHHYDIEILPHPTPLAPEPLANPTLHPVSHDGLADASAHSYAQPSSLCPAPPLSVYDDEDEAACSDAPTPTRCAVKVATL